MEALLQDIPVDGLLVILFVALGERAKCGMCNDQQFRRLQELQEYFDVEAIEAALPMAA